MLKKAILAGALICGVSSVALAADQAPQAAPPANGSVREQMTKTRWSSLASPRLRSCLTRTWFRPRIRLAIP